MPRGWPANGSSKGREHKHFIGGARVDSKLLVQGHGSPCRNKRKQCFWVSITYLQPTESQLKGHACPSPTKKQPCLRSGFVHLQTGSHASGSRLPASSQPEPILKGRSHQFPMSTKPLFRVMVIISTLREAMLQSHE